MGSDNNMSPEKALRIRTQQRTEPQWAEPELLKGDGWRDERIPMFGSFPSDLKVPIQRKQRGNQAADLALMTEKATP